MLTHLARPLNPRYQTVRIGLFVGFIAGLGGLGLGLQQGAGLGPATSRASNLAIASLLGWAIARELDPDDPTSATLAAIATPIITWWAGPISTGSMAALLILTRLLARTTGKAPTTFDQLMLVGLGVWASTSPLGWIVALGLSFATARDVRLPGSTSRLQLLTAVAIGIASTVSLAVSNGGTGREWTFGLLGLATIGLLGGATLRVTRPFTSTGDLTRAPLHPTRIRSSRRLAVVLTSATCLIVGAEAAVGLTPALVALAATRLRQKMTQVSKHS